MVNCKRFLNMKEKFLMITFHIIAIFLFNWKYNHFQDIKNQSFLNTIL